MAAASLLLLVPLRAIRAIPEPAAGLEQIGSRGGILVHGGEFVAPQAAGEAKGLRRLLEPLSDARQHPVSEGVSHAVVEILEIVDIQEEHGHVPPVLGGSFESMVEKHEDLPAVGQMRQ